MHNIQDCTCSYYVTNYKVPSCVAIIEKFEGEEYGYCFSYDDKDNK
jgi:hypothetical protein